MPQGYHHVTRDIRSQIYALKATGISLHKIAAIVERDVSTISREIKRNTGGRGYRYKQADEKAVERRANASRTPQKLTPTLVTIIEEKLLEKWSPDQISGRLKEKDIASISHEAIYQYIWKNKRVGGSLYKNFLRIRLRYNARFSLNFLDQLHHKPLDKLILNGGLQGLINSEMTQHGRSDG